MSSIFVLYIHLVSIDIQRISFVVKDYAYQAIQEENTKIACLVWQKEVNKQVAHNPVPNYLCTR